MAPASGLVSGAGTADTHQLYGSTASVLRWRPAATGFAALAIATVSFGGDPLRPASPLLRSPLCPSVATRCDRLRRSCDRTVSFGGDPLRPASPLLRSHCVLRWRPAATGFAALAIALCPSVATRCDRLRRSCDRHCVLRW